MRPPGRVGPPLVPPFGPIFTPMEETLIPQLLFPEVIPISAAIANKLWGTRISCSGTLSGWGSAPGFTSIDVASSS